MPVETVVPETMVCLGRHVHWPETVLAPGCWGLGGNEDKVTSLARRAMSASDGVSQGRSGGRR